MLCITFHNRYKYSQWRVIIIVTERSEIQAKLMRKIESKWNTLATVWIHFLTLPVSRGVLSTQYPISPANSSVAPPEENPYTAGSWRESGDRLMRNSPTPKDHIRSPCQTGGNKADTDIDSWHQNCLCVCEREIEEIDCTLLHEKSLREN